MDSCHCAGGYGPVARQDSDSDSRTTELQLVIEMEEAAERLHAASVRKLRAKLELERSRSASGSQRSYASTSWLERNTAKGGGDPTHDSDVCSWMSDDLEREVAALFDEFERGWQQNAGDRKTEHPTLNASRRCGT